MSAKVSPVPASTDPGLSFNTGSAPRPAVSVRESQSQEPDLRLVIEEDATGTYVYRTIDRRTGEVVQQFPVEAVLKLKGGNAYEAGAVIKTQA